MKKINYLLLLAIIKPLLLSSCYANNAITKADIVGAITKQIIIMDYVELSRNNSNLHDQLKLFNKNRNKKTFENVKISWHNARRSFEISETHLFGPAISLNIAAKMDTSPINTEDLLKTSHTFSQIPSYLSINYLNSLNENVIGYHAIEFLLFGQNGAKKFNKLSNSDIKLMLFLSNKMSADSKELLNSWIKGNNAFMHQFNVNNHTNKPINSQTSLYHNNNDSLLELVSGMINIVTEVGTGKLINPLGDDISTAKPTLVESKFSNSTTEDFFYNIVGLKQLWSGNNYFQTETTRQPRHITNLGLYDYVKTVDAKLAVNISKQIDKTLFSIVAISSDKDINVIIQQTPSLNTSTDIAKLHSVIDLNNTELAFSKQIMSENGRKRIKSVEKNLDDLNLLLTNKLLVLFE